MYGAGWLFMSAIAIVRSEDAREAIAIRPRTLTFGGMAGANVVHAGPLAGGENKWLASPQAKCVQLHESTTIDGKTLNPRADGNIWQFEFQTFRSLTGLRGSPGSYPASVQDAAAFKLWREHGWLVDWDADRYACHLG
jgi:hypothetical protein